MATNSIMEIGARKLLCRVAVPFCFYILYLQRHFLIPAFASNNIPFQHFRHLMIMFAVLGALMFVGSFTDIIVKLFAYTKKDITDQQKELALADKQKELALADQQKEVALGLITTTGALAAVVTFSITAHSLANGTINFKALTAAYSLIAVIGVFYILNMLYGTVKGIVDYMKDKNKDNEKSCREATIAAVLLLFVISSVVPAIVAVTGIMIARSFSQQVVPYEQLLLQSQVLLYTGITIVVLSFASLICKGCSLCCAEVSGCSNGKQLS